MLSNLGVVVGNLCVSCAKSTYYYTAFILISVWVCIKAVFLLKLNTPYTQLFPHIKNQINRLIFALYHINHSTYKNKYIFSKLFIINSLEKA